jgi:hypothetical protein
LRAEKLRKERELTRKYQLENQITEGNLLDRQSLARTFGLIADAMVSRINSATELPRTVREDILRELSTWPLAIEELARRQSRLPRGNGTHPEEDQSES